MNLPRHYAIFCDSKVGRAINMASAWMAALGTCASATVGVALIFGHATVTELGIVLIATGGSALVYLLTE